MHRYDLIQMGGLEAVKKEASFRKIDLYTNDGNGTYVGKFYGLYELFTVETQHTYGTEEELLFILGARKFIKYISPTICPNVETRISEQTISEMHRILTLNEISFDKSSSFSELYEKYFNHSDFNAGNYFHYFKQGKIMYYKYHTMFNRK